MMSGVHGHEDRSKTCDERYKVRQYDWHHATPSFALSFCLFPISLCLYCMILFHPSYLIIYLCCQLSRSFTIWTHLFSPSLPLLCSKRCCLKPRNIREAKRQDNKREYILRSIPKVPSHCQQIAVKHHFSLLETPLTRKSSFVKPISDKPF